MYNQEDEIAQFFAEQDGAFTKKEPEKDPNDGLPSIMRALNEPQPQMGAAPSMFPQNDIQQDEYEQDGFSQESFKPAQFQPDAVQADEVAAYGARKDAGDIRYDRLKEMEAQLEHDERISRCSIYAKKYMQMFLALIGGVALNALLTLLTYLVSKDYDIPFNVGVARITIAVLSAALSILYGLILLSLGNQHLDFRTAGCYYAIYGACNAVANSTSGMANFMFMILAAVFSVLYILKFAVAMSNSFDNVASYMAVSWESFKRIFTYVYAGIVICTLACFFPVLNIAAMVCLIILSFAAIAVSIWQIALILRSSQVMKQYANVVHV